MRYIPLKEADRKAMLKAIGVASIEDLFSAIPSNVRKKFSIDLPKAMTEMELRRFFGTAAAKESAVPSSGWASYLGGGCYEHFIPAAVDALSMRGEFATAYTPYQPEVSQGTLQAIFEFQSMVANLFGMEVANASMYDGASALAEAVLMALRIKKGSKIVLSTGVHPDYRSVVRNYLSDSEVEILETSLGADGRTAFGSIPTDCAAVVVAQPNFLGLIEQIEPLAKAAHAAGAMLIVSTTEATAFGLLKGPGSLGADIVAGEGQAFGNFPSFGGPHVGLFAARNTDVRQMPGRIVGRALDSDGKNGYVLTLSTREQHIRREKATSNICTNHSLCALRASIHMALMGSSGIRALALRNATLTARLREGLSKMAGAELPYKGPVYNEFVLRVQGSAAKFLKAMEGEKILAGITLSKWEGFDDRSLLVSATETKMEADIDRYLSAARRCL